MKATALLPALCGLALLPANPAFAAGPNLCQEQEDPLFACRLQNKKLVAACAVYDPALKQGYSKINYRFGTPEHIELSLPQAANKFQDSTYVDEATNNQPIEDDMYLRFVNGPFSYVLYTALGKGFDLKGLAVFRDDRLISKVSCEPDTLEHDMAQNSLLAIGVQSEVTGRRAFSFWRQLLPRNSSVLAQKPFGDPKYRAAPVRSPK